MTKVQNQRVPSGLISKSCKFLGTQFMQSVGKIETGKKGDIPAIKSPGIGSHLFPEKQMSHLSVVICSTTPSLPQPSRNEQVSNKSCILNRKWFFSCGCLKKKQAAVFQMAHSKMTAPQSALEKCNGLTLLTYCHYEIYWGRSRLWSQYYTTKMERRLCLDSRMWRKTSGTLTWLLQRILLPYYNSWLQPAASLLLMHQGTADQPCKAKVMAILRSTESKATYEKLLLLPCLPF